MRKRKYQRNIGGGSRVCTLAHGLPRPAMQRKSRDVRIALFTNYVHTTGRDVSPGVPVKETADAPNTAMRVNRKIPGANTPKAQPQGLMQACKRVTTRRHQSISSNCFSENESVATRRRRRTHWSSLSGRPKTPEVQNRKICKNTPLLVNPSANIAAVGK